MEDENDRRIRSLRRRVNAERIALKETMSFSRAAAVATVQQEVCNVSVILHEG